VLDSFTSNPSLYPKLPYDPVRDFTPISLLASAPVVLIVHPSIPVRTLKELIALAKARPGELNFATGGAGSATHLGVELFKAAAKIDLVPGCEFIVYHGFQHNITDAVPERCAEELKRFLVALQFHHATSKHGFCAY